MKKGIGWLRKDRQPHLCDNLYHKIASENRTLVLLVACGVERHTLSLNESTSLISKHFVKWRLIPYHKGEHEKTMQ